ncbi:MAG TPA: zinc ribbon domain-containing protein [Conexivisphaerales archaeon]|nr:zinc ribbon domain-containing protein [Conexivisphaerales archaeon]
MKCQACGAEAPEGARTCPRCGAAVSAAAPKPEPVERLKVEQIAISERGFTFRVNNNGTAPFTIEKIVFHDSPEQVRGILRGDGILRDGKVTMFPGDVADVNFQTSFNGISGIVYTVAVHTKSGRKYEVGVGFP